MVSTPNYAIKIFFIFYPWKCHWKCVSYRETWKSHSAFFDKLILCYQIPAYYISLGSVVIFNKLFSLKIMRRFPRNSLPHLQYQEKLFCLVHGGQSVWWCMPYKCPFLMMNNTRQHCWGDGWDKEILLWRCILVRDNFDVKYIIRASSLGLSFITAIIANVIYSFGSIGLTGHKMKWNLFIDVVTKLFYYIK